MRVLSSAVALSVLLTQLPQAEPAGGSEIVQRFLAREEAVPLVQSRAIRHMWARNERFKKEARLKARTTFDLQSGLRFEVLAQEGSKIVQDRVLLPILKGEVRAWSDGTASRSALTSSNYEFSAGDEPCWLRMRPRRKDTLLLEGAILVDPRDADLQRIEGRLSKNPSFWTTRVEIVREYQRIGAVRVPTKLASRAWVRIAGVSTLEMTYEYEEINGLSVGSPTDGQPVGLASQAPSPACASAPASRAQPSAATSR